MSWSCLGRASMRPAGYGSVSTHKISGELAQLALQYVGLAPAGQVQLDPPELNRTTTPAFPPGGGRPHFGTSCGRARSLAHGLPFRCPGPYGLAGGTGGPDMLTHSYLLACPASARGAPFEARQAIFFRH